MQFILSLPHGAPKTFPLVHSDPAITITPYRIAALARTLANRIEWYAIIRWQLELELDAPNINTMIDSRRIATGASVALVIFVALGTVASLWDNPLFARITPAGVWEIALLAALALLCGLFIAVRRPYCSRTSVGAASLFGFLGVACPICNPVLFAVFGGELLLTYYEPFRIYVAVLGVGVAGWAVVNELWARKLVKTASI